MVATHWIRDDEATKCMLCGVGFTVMNRRVRRTRRGLLKPHASDAARRPPR